MTNDECKSRRVLVALATYNEIENLPLLVDEILRAMPGADVLVVDDNSPDGTGRWCDQHSTIEPRLRCMHRQAKQGLGSATLVAMRHAIDHDYDVISTLDADGSHDPAVLGELVEAITRADVAIGSRYCEGGAIEGWPWPRRVLSLSLNAASRLLLRLPVRDTSNAFRAYRVGKLRELDLGRIQASGFAYLEEILWEAARSGATLVEVPITFHQRRAGRSKVSLPEAAGKITTIGKLGWRSLLGR
jgi:dolichol-phosphate mannosyltransferase